MSTLSTTELFRKSTLTVARELLGKELVRRTEGGELRGIIHEVEAYVGPQDLACHASKGLTERTKVMFGPTGHWYVYLIYGMYWMLNLVTEREGFPSAILIRGAGEWDGPGKLTRAMGITGELNGKLADSSSGLWIEDHGIAVPSGKIERTPRIGVDYAGEWAKRPYRFVLVE